MNKMRFNFFLVSLFLIFTISESCDTNEDTEYPEISVKQPAAGSKFENGDTISIQAVFSDDTQLSTIEIMLVDEDNKPMLANIVLTPDGNPFSFKGIYIIDDPMLPGNKYQLRFRASDGINTTNKFVEIQVFELQQQMLYPIIVTHPESDKWQAYRMTSTNDWQEFHSHSGDYCGSAVNSAASQFYICGKSQSDLTAVKLPEGTLQWNVKPGTNQSHRWFEGITFKYPNLYVTTSEGNVRGYNANGSEIYKSETYMNAFPDFLALTRNYAISSFKDAFSNDKFLVTFHNPGGAMIWNKYIETTVIGLIYTEGDEVLVFSNGDGQADISLYNGTENTLNLLHSFYVGTFYKVAAVDNDNYLISTNAGVYRYQLSNNSLSPFVTEAINSNITCDLVSQEVYVSSGKMLKVYSFPFASLLETYPLPDSTVDIHLLYNK